MVLEQIVLEYVLYEEIQLEQVLFEKKSVRSCCVIRNVHKSVVGVKVVVPGACIIKLHTAVTNSVVQ
jgi:hypothetical protein